MDCGFDEILVKPVTLKGLVEVIMKNIKKF